MSLRGEVIDAICALQGLDYHPSEKDEARIADAVVEVIQAREVQVQRLQGLVDQLTELVESGQEDAARSMRERAAQEVVFEPHRVPMAISDAILNLPLLVEESK